MPDRSISIDFYMECYLTFCENFRTINNDHKIVLKTNHIINLTFLTICTMHQSCSWPVPKNTKLSIFKTCNYWVDTAGTKGLIWCGTMQHSSETGNDDIFMFQSCVMSWVKMRNSSWLWAGWSNRAIPLTLSTLLQLCYNSTSSAHVHLCMLQVDKTQFLAIFIIVTFIEKAN